MKKWMAAAAMAASVVALSSAPAAAADKVVLMLNWYVYGEHAPFYYGKAKGIYAAEGIDLEIQEGRGSAATTQAVAAKTADFGYVMDQSMKIKDATGKDVYPIKFADYGINMVSSGMVANTDYVKANADLVKRFMSATTKAVEGAEKDPKAAAQSILDANPKGGKIDTLTQGFELTIPLYRTAETKARRPFQVTDQNMTDSVNLMVEYGGLDAKARENPKAFYTNEYLPK